MTAIWGVEMGSWPMIRDIAVTFFSLSMGAWEILAGGGRPSVLTFLTGLLLAPWVAKIDASIRNKREGNGQ